jgi:hypothetical protein
MATAQLTNITPPRVPLLDPKTGLVSREWYRFFLSLFVLTGSGQNTASLTDLQVGPPTPTQEDFGEIVISINSLKTQPSQESALDQIAELQKQIDGLKKQIECPCTELTAELQKQIEGLQMQPPVPEMVASGMVAPEPLWIDLVSRPSTLVGTSTVSGISGDVRLHAKVGQADVYRFIPSNSDPLIDSFYSTFAASVLSGLIVSRG